MGWRGVDAALAVTGCLPSSVDSAPHTTDIISEMVGLSTNNPQNKTFATRQNG
jgi:hypothetical protein